MHRPSLRARLYGPVRGIAPGFRGGDDRGWLHAGL